MNAVTRNSRFLIAVVLLAIRSLGQLAYAQDSQDCSTRVPQWVLDRQEYETTFVYVLPGFGFQRPGECRPQIVQFVA
jgi:hypothetical protein